MRCFLLLGGLSFAELSILLDRSLVGLSKIVGCPAIQTLGAPYCRELIRKAVSQRDAVKQEHERDESSFSGDEEENEEEDDEEEDEEERDSSDADENVEGDDSAIAASTDEVPTALLVNILHEVGRKNSSPARFPTIPPPLPRKSLRQQASLYPWVSSSTTELLLSTAVFPSLSRPLILLLLLLPLCRCLFFCRCFLSRRNPSERERLLS